MKSIDLLEVWLREVETDPKLRSCIVEFARGRGQVIMSEICSDMDTRFQLMARDQDNIGWRRFMEGMICLRLREIQLTFAHIEGARTTPEKWGQGIVTNELLETTHGQWLYRCVQVHNRVQGTLATLRKEDLQREIENQQEQGFDDLLEEDRYLAEVNLEDLENSSGEQQEYWLVAMKVAREAKLLQGLPQPNTDRPGDTRGGRFITQHFTC
jgi:hypothetical protein